MGTLAIHEESPGYAERQDQIHGSSPATQDRREVRKCCHLLQVSFIFHLKNLSLQDY